MPARPPYVRLGHEADPLQQFTMRLASLKTAAGREDLRLYRRKKRNRFLVQALYKILRRFAPQDDNELTNCRRLGP